MAADAWEEYAGTPEELPKMTEKERSAEGQARLAEAAEKLMYVRAQIEAHKAEEKGLVDSIASLTDPVAGSVTLYADKLEITVTHPERWQWDDEILATIVGSDAETLPSFISKGFRVNKAKFQRLKESEQDEYKPALTRTLTAPKVEVKPHV